MDAQINEAADAGLSFFSFCWYFKKNKPLTESNTILNLYHNSPNRNRLKHCLLIANHEGNEIGPADWHKVSAEWIKQFKTSSYLTVDGKPLLIIFEVNSLIKQFGTTAKVKEALNYLRDSARKEGLNGVTIAACVGSYPDVALKAKACGFDITTAYNLHKAGYKNRVSRQIPIDSLINSERMIWDRISAVSKLPYIPVATLNWDPRPWADSSNNYNTKPYYVGFSSGSVFRSIQSLVRWMRLHQTQTTKEQVALLYAWNEYGEGAWLTPSKNSSDKPLEGLKKALSQKQNN